ncbi:acyl-coenzyme A diphosphatase NUDT19 isoform X1 [Stomoxys calcitrans]|uniref:acyl-coenzyme A diphosphatase NUDT19 isoform X1 n=2 Tax=Stomoxys calcitrans TaxID=35570 RepID=UPI0027E32D11|nr:acyl-coenzyme A diphosphatase NUDT19 isoform X1 [Stomoxys calcitrans]
MAKQIVANIRKSSSLIVLARDKIKAEKQTDYKVLMFKRPPQATFMPNSAVFPGGVLETHADETPLWRKHFDNMGVSKLQLSLLTQGTGKKSDIFTKENPESLERELSLRIATVREAFEELGVIFCRDRKSLTDGSDDGYGKFKEDFDRQHWQKLVHDDATQFLKLCETLEIVPDLWSLYEWSNWVTPATFKKRFNAAFFVIVLKTIPDLIKEKHEVSEFAWKTPAEYLQQHFKKEIWLPPPQFYELSRLLNYSELEQFKKFAQKRSAEGLEAILPIERKCNDSRVNLLPGDDLYDNPNSSTDLVSTHKTAKEYRNGVKNVHRIEFYDSNDMVVQLNFKPPHGHLTPINTNPKKHE